MRMLLQFYSAEYFEFLLFTSWSSWRLNLSTTKHFLSTEYWIKPHFKFVRRNPAEEKQPPRKPATAAATPHTNTPSGGQTGAAKVKANTAVATTRVLSPATSGCSTAHTTDTILTHEHLTLVFRRTSKHFLLHLFYDQRRRRRYY